MALGVSAASARSRDAVDTDARQAHARRTAATLTARVVVGADGLRSVVARRLGLARSRRWPKRDWPFVTHYRGVAALGPPARCTSSAMGTLASADVGSGHTNVAVVVPADAAPGSVGADRRLSGRVGRTPPAPGAAVSRRQPDLARTRDGTRLRSARAGCGRPVRRWSVTPPTFSIRSRVRASTPRCAAASSSRRTRSRPFEGRTRSGAPGGHRARGLRSVPAPRIRRQVDRRAAPGGRCGSAASHGLARGRVGAAAGPRRFAGRSRWRFRAAAPRPARVVPLGTDRLVSVDPDTFRSVLGRFASGVTVVTVRDDGGGLRRDGQCLRVAEPHATPRARSASIKRRRCTRSSRAQRSSR